jgi:hypothetical protein
MEGAYRANPLGRQCTPAVKTPFLAAFFVTVQPSSLCGMWPGLPPDCPTKRRHVKWMEPDVPPGFWPSQWQVFPVLFHFPKEMHCHRCSGLYDAAARQCGEDSREIAPPFTASRLPAAELQSQVHATPKTYANLEGSPSTETPSGAGLGRRLVADLRLAEGAVREPAGGVSGRDWMVAAIIDLTHRLNCRG